MSHNTSPQGNGCSNDELGPELRDAVHAVLQDEPPEDWAKETLERIRQESRTKQFRTTPRRMSRRAKLVAVATIAASLAIVFQLERFDVLEDLKHAVSSVFSTPDVDDEGAPRDAQHPHIPSMMLPGENVILANFDTTRPTVWTYRQVSRTSPEAFDALLDEHAASMLSDSSDSELAGVMQELL